MEATRPIIAAPSDVAELSQARTERALRAQAAMNLRLLQREPNPARRQLLESQGYGILKALTHPDRLTGLRLANVAAELGHAALWPTGAGATEPSPQVDRAGSLTVKQLAAELGFTVKRTYRLLGRDAIPGAFKTAEGRATHWYIPADAARRFVSKGERRAA